VTELSHGRTVPAWVEAALELDASGRPACRDARRVLDAIEAVVRHGVPEAVDEHLVRGFLRGAGERYAEHVADGMRTLPPARFQMGTDAAAARHFCGETPRHRVELSAFGMASTAVTAELFALLDRRRLDVSAGDGQRPAVDVSWFEAALFALWMGCRLPTEAEWEFACGAGVDSEWCCEREEQLPRYAWLSENAGAALHPVARREPNSFGLFDMHGNVWEWCADAYAQDWYGRSPRRDPVNRAAPADGDRVCRGGSMHALAEMCRTRYRMHEPPGFWAHDLGFRLARDVDPPGIWEPWR
jgi:sulfatase modifying factor 1